MSIPDRSHGHSADGDRARLVAACRDHLSPAKDRYIALWQARFQ
ncbi:hypothetical protein [Limimaricola litoreus]|nr:hypothetical protein [Limimaricola litoreus]